MINTPESPPYVPATHLTSGSLLTTSQLVAHFQDFRNSLRYVSTAPELVFERLVANLYEDFNTALRLERQEHASNLKICQSSNDSLEKELMELKLTTSKKLSQALGEPPYACSCSRKLYLSKGQQTTTAPPPTVVAIKSKPNPRIGSFHTNEIRYFFQVRALTSKVISFGRPYSAPPGLPVGLTALDIGHNSNVRVKSYTSNTYDDRFEIHIDSWKDTTLFGAGCTWLEIEADDPDFQFGSYNTLEDHPSDKCQAQNSRRVTFPRAYDVPPVVVVWLVGFDMNSDRNWRIKTFATDITTAGFTIHIDTWGDSVLYSGISSWVAYTANKPEIYSGCFSTQDLHTPPQKCNSGYEKFSSNVFSTPPRTILAINSLDMDCGRVLRLMVKTSLVSTEGMRWHLDAWVDTIVNSAGASYIALS